MKSPSNWGPEYANEFDAIYPDLAAKYHTALYPFFLDGVALDRAFVQSDGLHPTAKGVAEIVKRDDARCRGFFAAHPATRDSRQIIARRRCRALASVKARTCRCPDCSPPSKSPNEIRDELYRLRIPLPGARWMKPESYHITLRFAGDIGNVEAREFMANLSMIEPDGFELRLSGLGVFGGDDPHAIWAGVEPTPQLEDLARAHEKAARNAGFARNAGLQAARTLARLKHSNVEAMARFLTRTGGYRSERFFVTRTLLMSSRPGTGGGPYGIEDRFPMRGMAFLSEDGDATGDA